MKIVSNFGFKASNFHFMGFIAVTQDNREEYNAVVNHPLQSFEWGEFRIATGVQVIRRALEKNGKITDGFSLTIHKIPGLPYNIGYLPKGNTPTKELLGELQKIGKREKCVYIQLEPNVIQNSDFSAQSLIMNSEFKIINSFHPLFTRYTFILDLTPSEDELLRKMHSKTRYNIRVAQKNGVYVEEDNLEKGFEEYMNLTRQTTSRQGFYAHTPIYHKTQWKVLSKKPNNQSQIANNRLQYHLLHAKYKDSNGKIHTLTTWVLFVYGDTLYYPYGASSSLFRNIMASNLMCWEAIKFGKKNNLKKFDMWGALGPNPNTKDPWYGFHRFKEGYGGQLTEFVGSYDLVIDPLMYQIVKLADKARWMYLRIKKR